jgi:hypothetical protein
VLKLINVNQNTMAKRVTFNRAYELAYAKYGSEMGMFGRLLNKNGNPVRGKFISYGLNRILTKEELIK